MKWKLCILPAAKLDYNLSGHLVDVVLFLFFLKGKVGKKSSSNQTSEQKFKGPAPD